MNREEARDFIGKLGRLKGYVSPENRAILRTTMPEVLESVDNLREEVARVTKTCQSHQDQLQKNTRAKPSPDSLTTCIPRTLDLSLSSFKMPRIIDTPKRKRTMNGPFSNSHYIPTELSSIRMRMASKTQMYGLSVVLATAQRRARRRILGRKESASSQYSRSHQRCTSNPEPFLSFSSTVNVMTAWVLSHLFTKITTVFLRESAPG